jgi:tRNA threonylcarbamoyladenosine biosynthesis protein TsaE
MSGKKIVVMGADELVRLGEKIGKTLKGGEVFELIGDVGTGKTTFTKGLARGLGVTAEIASPSFTIERSYAGRDGIILNHYDFYRLEDPGIMKNSIAESVGDPGSVTVVEWGENTRDVLPRARRTVRISYLAEGDGREVEL